MTPERPRRADATDAQVETPTAVSRAEGPSALPEAGSAPLYAALDLGTNSCRMLIAQPLGSQFTIIDSFSKSVQLGVGLEASGRLSRSSMGRTIQALRICEKKIEKHGVRRMRLVATEACRRARNAKDFIRQVRRETGLSLEIIAPEEEARLAVISCAPLVNPTTEQLLVVDIGGGSTELVLLEQSRQVEPARIERWASVPLGVVSLAEAGAWDFELMRATAHAALAGVWGWPEIAPEPACHLLATSGVVTSLVGLQRGQGGPGDGPVTGQWLTRVGTEQVLEGFLAVAPAAREALAPIGPGRGDLVTAGGAILLALWDLWPAARLRAADRGLREGLVRQLARELALTPGA
jgi:exopolyphosphatase/guanosine-5'-triphosphate,3'-diphosphate pyrophosphatase